VRWPLSDTLIAELLLADQIVIGTPMYNFAVPAVVKAWIDHVVRLGKTFNYGATGREGLAKGRKGFPWYCSYPSQDPLRSSRCHARA
jgi:FMN-dependent NADH-azoreductase